MPALRALCAPEAGYRISCAIVFLAAIKTLLFAIGHLLSHSTMRVNKQEMAMTEITPELPEGESRFCTLRRVDTSVYSVAR